MFTFFVDLIHFKCFLKIKNDEAFSRYPATNVTFTDRLFGLSTTSKQMNIFMNPCYNPPSFTYQPYQLLAQLKVRPNVCEPDLISYQTVAPATWQTLAWHSHLNCYFRRPMKWKLVALSVPCLRAFAPERSPCYVTCLLINDDMGRVYSPAVLFSRQHLTAGLRRTHNE